MKRITFLSPRITITDSSGNASNESSAPSPPASLSNPNPRHPESRRQIQSPPQTRALISIRSQTSRAASFSQNLHSPPAGIRSPSASQAHDLEAGQLDQATTPPLTVAAIGSRPLPAGRADRKHIAQGFKRIALTTTKAYLSFVGIGAAIKLAKNPGDLRPDALQFVKAAFTGTERADSLEVQKSLALVLQTYGDFIDTKTQCVDPVITFALALRDDENGKQHSGQFIYRSKFIHATNKGGTAINSTRANNSTITLPNIVGKQVQSGELQFTAYNLYLPQVAVHEYLHCFTHPGFLNTTNQSKLVTQLGSTLVEGTTQYLTLQTPFDRQGDFSGKFSSFYPEEVKFVGKIVDKVGIDTLKKAYFSGDRSSNKKVLDAAAEEAESLLRNR